MSDSFVTPWTVACQAPLSMEFSRQEYWSGLPSLLHGIFPTQGLKLSLLHCRQIFYHLSYQGSPNTVNLNPIESCMCAKLLQLYQTLCDPMDCSLQGSSVHGSLQARTLENTGLPCPPPGDLLTQGSNPCLLSPLHWQAGSLPLALPSKMAFLEVQMVKNLPAVQETWVWSLCQEDPLKKRMVTHSSILAWTIPWIEKPGGLYIAHGITKSWPQQSD